MGKLTLQELERIEQDEVGAPLGTQIELRDLSTQAGHLLMSCHQWQWAEGREAVLRPRASLSITGATWTEATKTLTKTGGFASYSFLSQDKLKVTSGTGATPGTYVVASRTDDDSIVLETSIGSGADGSTNIAFSMPNDQINLPSDFDFQELIAYSVPDSLVGFAEPTSPQTLLDLRSYPGLGTTIGFFMLIHYVRTSDAQPVPRAEVWPASTSTDESLVIWYRAGWKTPDTDEEVLAIPEWLNLLYIELFKAVVMGHEEPEGGSVDARVTAVLGGRLFQIAKQRDSLIQPPQGPYTGTWMTGGSGRSLSRYDFPPPPITSI